MLKIISTSDRLSRWGIGWFLVLPLLASCGSKDDTVATQMASSANQPAPLTDPSVFQHYVSPYRTERVEKTFAPGAGGEILLRLDENVVLLYQWVVDGGSVHSDLHGHKSDQSDYWVQYRLDESSPADYGSIVSPFDGMHGWYFRNDGEVDVTVRLRVSGYFTDIEY